MSDSNNGDVTMEIVGSDYDAGLSDATIDACLDVFPVSPYRQYNATHTLDLQYIGSCPLDVDDVVESGVSDDAAIHRFRGEGYVKNIVTVKQPHLASVMYHVEVEVTCLVREYYDIATGDVIGVMYL